MNLKESFRYQNFLGSLLSSAASSLTDVQHCLTTTKTHLRNKANEDAEDVTEQVDIGEFHKNDDVLRFMLYLIDEREKLTTAIGRAKASIGFDLDAAVETNKFRQTVVRNINMMLRYKVSKRTERGTDYKFNAEGNQTPYYYDIEVVTSENFDRAQAKAAAQSVIAKADEVSAAIDTALINTQVEYAVPFNVNDSFDDAMAAFPCGIIPCESGRKENYIWLSAENLPSLMRMCWLRRRTGSTPTSLSSIRPPPSSPTPSTTWASSTGTSTTPSRKSTTTSGIWRRLRLG